MSTNIEHPIIALCIGIILAIIPIVGIKKGTCLLAGVVRRKERPVRFWASILIWTVIAVIIIAGSVESLLLP